MRRIVLVVGIGAGLFGMATLHNTDSMAVELVHKTNFNLPKVVLPPPAPEYPVPKAPPPSVPPLAPIAPLDPLYESDKPGDYYVPKLVLKKNFNLPPASGNRINTNGKMGEPLEGGELVLPPPAPEKPGTFGGDPAGVSLSGFSEGAADTLEPDDFSNHRLVLKKNFNLSKLVAAYPNEKVISVDLADPNPYDGKPPDPTELADEVYYRPPVMFPLPNGGNDHADSPDHSDRTAGNDRRRSPRP
jgi:hypothetical protein